MLATYAAIRLACFAAKVLAAILGIIVACGLIIAGLGWCDIALALGGILVVTWDSEHASNTAYAIIMQHRAVRALRPPARHFKESRHV